MNRWKCLLLASMAVPLLARIAAASVRCTVVTADTTRHDGRLVDITADGFKFQEGDATASTKTLPLKQLLWVERTGDSKDSAAKPQPFILILRDGQRLSGTPGAMFGDALEWRSAIAGMRKVALKDITQIASTAAEATKIATPSAAITQDELRLTNGDIVTGVLSASDATTVTCQNTDGQAVPVAWANVRSIRLAPAGEASIPTGSFRVELRDGSRFRCESVLLDQDEFSLAIDGSKVGVNGNEIVAIENLAAASRLLADAVPTSTTYEPYFPRVDATAAGAGRDGDSVTIGGMRSRSFIAMRPRGAMTWTLDAAGTKTFRTRYGIPAGLPLADVTVRVKFDDKVVFEKTKVRSGVLSDLVQLDIGMAKSITLEVDFGESFDVQDRLYWVEPLLSTGS